MNDKQELILASASPRRKEILEKLGLAFAVCPAADESAPPGLPPEERVVALARCKAEEVASKYPDRLVIGADTLVEVDGEALGKPRSQDEAVSMLLRLQGRVHHVWTGVWACAPGKAGGFADGTEVEFYPMSRREAEAYAATGEPLDKAGAYGIQGRGLRYVRGIRGDFYSVMGLPGARLLRFLREEFGFEGE